VFTLATLPEVMNVAPFPTLRRLFSSPGGANVADAAQSIRHDGPMIGVLEVTTSPRSTWLWAATVDAAAAVRALLDAHSMSWELPYRYGREVPQVTDVEIGVTAAEACEVLAEAGWTFRWHPDQEPLNRRETLRGVPISQSE